MHNFPRYMQNYDAEDGNDNMCCRDGVLSVVGLNVCTLLFLEGGCSASGEGCGTLYSALLRGVEFSAL